MANGVSTGPKNSCFIPDCASSSVTLLNNFKKLVGRRKHVPVSFFVSALLESVKVMDFAFPDQARTRALKPRTLSVGVMER